MAMPNKKPQKNNDKNAKKKQNQNNNKNEEKKQEHNDNDSNNNNHDHGHQHHDSHKCNHKGCQHDHGDMEFGTSLYEFIDKKHIKCLNEADSNSGKAVFKPFDERLDSSIYVESDVDGELLFTVYFTAEVQLRSIQLTMHDEDSMPTILKLWNDKPDKIDFDNHEDHKCSQSIELAFDNKCELHWKTKQHRFNDLTVLKMLFQKENNDDDEEIRLNYIGLKGDYKGPKSRRAVHAIYERAANPSDHANITKAKDKNASKNDSVDGK